MGIGKLWMVRFAPAWITLAATGLGAQVEETKDSACLECHADKTLTKTNAVGKEISLFVDVAKLAGSSHKTNTCASCHNDITAKHPDDEVAAKPVACRRCHERQSESYGASVHGLALRRAVRMPPTARIATIRMTCCPALHPLRHCMSQIRPRHVAPVTIRRRRISRRVFMAKRWSRACAMPRPAPIAIPSIR